MSRQDGTGMAAVIPATDLELLPAVSFASTCGKAMLGSGYLGGACTPCVARIPYPIDAS